MATFLKGWYTNYFRSGTSTPYGLGDVRGKINAYLESQNTTNNSSYIRLDHYLEYGKTNTSVGGTFTGTSTYRANQGSYGGTYQTVDLNRTIITNNSTTSMSVLVGSTYRTVYHTTTGTGTLYVDGSIHGFVRSNFQDLTYDGTTASSFTATLPTIARYTTINSYTVTVPTTLGRLSASWSASNTCDLVQYSLNGGSWTTAQTGDRTSGSFNIDSLTPNTSYTLKIRVRRKDSQLYTESSSVSKTTTAQALFTAPSANFSFNLGSNLNITFTNPSGSTVNLALESPSGTSRLTRNGITSPYTLVLTEAEINTLYGLSPTSKEVSVRLVLTTASTYKDYESGKAVIVNQNPDWTGYSYIENTISNSILGTNQVLIKNNNQLVITCDEATAKLGTTITKYQATIGTGVYETTDLVNRTITINNISTSGSLSCVVKAIDGRGNFTTNTKTITVLDYINPTISDIVLTRTNDYEEESFLSFNGQISLLTNAGSNNNSILDLKFRTRITGGTWSGYTDLDSNANYSYDTITGSYALTTTEIGNFDTTKSYEVEISISDKIKTKALSGILNNGIPLVSYRKDKIGINKVPVNGALDVNGDIYANGVKLGGGGSATGDTLPIGGMIPWTTNTIPDNWLLCDGQAVSRTTYSALFAVVGTTYGVGDNSTTFNVPNIKGRTIVGRDSADTDFDALGETRGAKTHTLTIDELASHVHLGYSNTGTQSRHVINTTWDTTASQDGVTGSMIGSAGGNQPHNNIQPSIVENYIIKAQQSSGVVATVVDNLTSTSTTNALSANQGKVLNDTKLTNTWQLIDGLSLGSGATSTQPALIGAKQICFSIYTLGSTAGSSSCFYIPNSGYAKYCLGNSTDPKLGVYVQVNNSTGVITVSSYQHDGVSVIKKVWYMQ